MTGTTGSDPAAPDRPPPAGWNVGDRVLGQYDLLAVYRGGMGLVYRARHLAWDLDVAIKRPLPGVLTTGRDRERFVREAGTWVGLGLHPHICNSYYVRTVTDVPMVVAEYVDGGSLADAIRDGRLYRGTCAEVLERVLDVAVQAAWGLGHAHANGVLHRDVKPANILFDDHAVKVTDFGLAGALALPGTYPGTRRYASPEQASGAPSGTAADVWSLAVSILEMLTGEATWLTGPAAGAALAEATPVTQLGPVPSALTELLGECLRWDPADRPQTADAVVASLVGIYRVVTGQPYPRDLPSEAEARADELNNRALSLLDLGRENEADELLDRALKADPRHPEATYNSGVLRWRRARATDDAVLDGLDAATHGGAPPGRTGRLVDLVDRERGAGAATIVLEIDRRPSGTAVLDVSPDGTCLLVEECPGTVAVHDLPSGRLRRRLHGDPVKTMAIRIRADGRTALSTDVDGTSFLWDLSTGQALVRRTWRRRRDVPLDVCLVPETATALIVDGTARLARVTRLRSRARSRVLRTRARVSEIAATPDGSRVLTGHHDGTVDVWDLTTHRRTATLAEHTDLVRKIAVDPSGRFAVTIAGGFEDFTPRVWDLADGRCVRRLEGHGGPLTSVVVSPDGLVLVGCGDGTVRVWDLATGAARQVLTSGSESPVDVAAVSRSPAVAITTELDGAVRVWDVVSGRCRRTLVRPGGQHLAPHVAVTPDGRTVVWAGRNTGRIHTVADPVASPLQICRSRTASELTAIHERARDGLDAVRAAEQRRDNTDARRLLEKVRALPGHERSPEVMDAWRRLARASPSRRFRTAWVRRVIDTGTIGLGDVEAAPDGRSIVSAHDDGTARMWDLAGGEQLAVLAGHAGTVRSVCVTPDGRRVVTGGEDGTARVWDPTLGNEIAVLAGHDGAVWSVCVTPDGGRVVTGGEDGTARVWDPDRGEQLVLLTGHLGAVAYVCPGPDVASVLTAGRTDGSVRRWDLSTGRWTGVPETFHVSWLVEIRSAAAGLLLTVNGIPRGPVRVRDLATGRFVRAIEPDTGGFPTSACATPDGRFVLVATRSPTVEVWDLDDGVCVGSLVERDHEVIAVRMTPDGQHVLTAGDDGAIRVWEIDWEIPS